MMVELKRNDFEGKEVNWEAVYNHLERAPKGLN